MGMAALRDASCRHSPPLITTGSGRLPLFYAPEWELIRPTPSGSQERVLEPDIQSQV